MEARTAGRDHDLMRFYLPLALALFVLGCLLAAQKHTLAVASLHDLFLFLDGIHQVDQGLVPSTDFVAAIGVLNYWLPWLGYRIIGQFGGALEAANVVVLVFVLAIAVCILQPRTSRFVGGALVVAMVMLLVAPWYPSKGALVLTQVMFYNRWCWPVLTLLLLFAIPRRKPPSLATTGLEAAIAISLLLFLFFNKMTYFAVGFVFVAGFGIVSKQFRAVAVAVSAVVWIVVAAVEAASGYVGDYLADLRTAIEASGPLVLSNLDGLIWSNALDYGLAALAVAVVAVRGRLTLGSVLVSGYIAGSGLAIMTQNGAGGGDSAVYVFALTVLFAQMHRLVADEPRPAKLLVCVLLAAFLFPYLARQTQAVVSFLAPDAVPIGLPRMEGVLLGAYDIRYPNGDLVRDADGEYTRRLRRGVELLEGNGIAAPSLLMTLSSTDPFSAMLDLPRARGNLWCIDPGRLVSTETAPLATVLFADVDYIMVPAVVRCPYSNARILCEARDFLLATYGTFIDEHYRVVATNADWRLLERVRSDVAQDALGVVRRAIDAQVNQASDRR